ncbi:MAG: hypothetical protein ACE10E_11320 [Acidiferrobacterales bacterium]
MVRAVTIEAERSSRNQVCPLAARKLVFCHTSYRTNPTRTPVATYEKKRSTIKPTVPASSRHFKTRALVSQATVDLIGDGFAPERIGEIEIRGKKETVTVYQLA